MTDNDDQPTLNWRKSTRSNSGGCLEIVLYSGRVLLRDSRCPGGPVLSVPPHAWTALLERVRGPVTGLPLHQTRFT